MDVTLYKNFSVENKVAKNITQVAKYTGVQLVEPTEDDSVTIRMTVPTDTLKWSNVNYFEWDGAYYFLDSVDKQANMISVLHGRIDLLMTYQSAVKLLRGHLVRSSSNGSPRLDDAARVYAVDTDKLVSEWPNQISDSGAAGFYALVTAQSGWVNAS